MNTKDNELTQILSTNFEKVCLSHVTFVVIIATFKLFQGRHKENLSVYRDNLIFEHTNLIQHSLFNFEPIHL